MRPPEGDHSKALLKYLALLERFHGNVSGVPRRGGLEKRGLRNRE